MTRLWTIATIAISLVTPGGASAQQKLSIPSVTPATLTALLHHETTPATVAGELYLPPKASGPLPALVLLHGSGGLQGPTGTNIRKWAGTFAGWGVAALVVDSFGPRGIKETGTNQEQLSGWADDADALALGGAARQGLERQRGWTFCAPHDLGVGGEHLRLRDVDDLRAGMRRRRLQPGLRDQRQLRSRLSGRRLHLQLQHVVEVQVDLRGRQLPPDVR